jgi:hypothetical protein
MKSRHVISMLIFIGVVQLSFPLPGRAQNDRITYQGVEIRPGDVINLHGGLATVIGPALTYGHSALYLGIDPETRQRTFLDYTTTKDPAKPFLGRILLEEDFIVESMKEHKTFDVFRLDDTITLNQRELVQEAKRVSISRTRWENSWGLTNVCVSAVTQVLSKATGKRISFISPDSFMKPPFHKLPELRDRSIDLATALKEVKAQKAVDARSAQLHQLVPKMAAAQRQIKRTSLTAEEYASLSELRRQRLRQAKWDYMVTLVGYACSEPGNLRSVNDAGNVAGVTLDKTEMQTLFDADRKNLSGCQREIFDKILATEGGVSIDKLIDLGIAYRSQHGFHVTLTKMFDKMKAFGAEVTRAFASLGTTSSGSRSGSSGNSSSRSESNSRSSYGDSSTLRQLRGIAASGIWPN